MSPGLGTISDCPPGLPYHPGHATVPALTKPCGHGCLGWLDHELVNSQDSALFISVKQATGPKPDVLGTDQTFVERMNKSEIS